MDSEDDPAEPEFPDEEPPFEPDDPFELDVSEAESPFVPDELDAPVDPDDPDEDEESPVDPFEADEACDSADSDAGGDPSLSPDPPEFDPFEDSPG